MTAVQPGEGRTTVVDHSCAPLDDVGVDDVVTITPYADGPLLVRGDVRIVGADGEVIDPRRRTVALCRCGRSALKPFCDGSHQVAGFRATGGDERPPAGRAAAEPA